MQMQQEARLPHSCASSRVRRYTAVTCSEDGTVRIWDCENLKQKTVLKPTLRRAGRCAINAVAYNTEGSVVAGGLFDGSIQLWDVRGGLTAGCAALSAMLWAASWRAAASFGASEVHVQTGGGLRGSFGFTRLFMLTDASCNATGGCSTLNQNHVVFLDFQRRALTAASMLAFAGLQHGTCKPQSRA